MNCAMLEEMDVGLQECTRVTGAAKLNGFDVHRMQPLARGKRSDGLRDLKLEPWRQVLDLHALLTTSNPMAC